MVHEIDHMPDLHVDSSFCKQSMKIDNYHKITEWIDSSTGQSTVIQELDKNDLKFENGSHFICSLNLNNPELTVFMIFRMTSIASRDQEIVNSLIGNNNK